MEYNQFKQLLLLKGIREKETVRQLEDFIDKFPYCQTAHLLFAKALHDQDNIHYDHQLKLAAAYASNREVLRGLVGIKTEEVEFEFPPAKKQEPGQPLPVPENEAPPAVIQKDEKRFEEWYSEDEISGRAFEEQKESERPVDPHEVIRKRLNEILAGPAKQAAAANEQAASSQSRTAEEKIIVQEDIRANHSGEIKADAEETVYKEDLAVEKKLEEEMIHPLQEKSAEEKTIMAQAEKARDFLDKMELEHALEESILESLEKLPPIVSVQSARPVSESSRTEKGGAEKLSPMGRAAEKRGDPDTPRSFTEWLKAMRPGSAAPFEEVRAPKPKAVPAPEIPLESDDEPESQLSDDELIEKFLLEDPKIVPSKAEFYSPVSQAKKSVMDHDDVVSETLAQIYFKQGNIQKARWCYEKLILLHPEKSAFFAALLAEIPEGGD
jgi:hypothetical protein